jgi:xylose isomerase
VRRPVEAATSPALSARTSSVWPGIEGYNYPFQTPYAESWAWLIEGIGAGRGGDREHGRKLFLEHKNSEPAMKILMRNIGMTLHVIHKLRAEGVTTSGQHGLAAPAHERREPRRVRRAARRRGAARPQHANSGWGTFDDDNMVGATAFMETVELALELRRASYGSTASGSGFDLFPYTEDQVAAVRRSVEQWRFIDEVAERIDDAALREAQAAQGRRRRLRARLRALGRPRRA